MAPARPANQWQPSSTMSRDATDIADDRREPGRHRLDDGVPETVGSGRHHEQIGAGVQLDQRRRVGFAPVNRHARGSAQPRRG